MVNLRESDIETYLIKRIKHFKGETRKVKWINRRGAPDRLLWIPGWVMPVLFELKAPGKPLQDHQRREQRRLRKMGIKCYKIDSPYDVDRFLV